MSFVGVDVGTTGVKAVAFDDKGAMLGSAYREYPLLFPFPGAAELDSDRVIACAKDVIASVAAKAARTSPVQCIGVASQGEAFTPLSVNGTMLGNGMTSSDSRAAEIMETWTTGFGRERIYQITGHAPHPMNTIYKLLWVKEHQPEVWERACKFLFYADLLAYALTGATVTDYTLAARSMLFDVHAKRWSLDILDAIGLETSRLPDPSPSGTVAGEVLHELASELGLEAGVKVAVSGHDQPVGAFGCGAGIPGYAGYSNGTTDCITPCIRDLVLNKELLDANLCFYPHVIPDMYTTVAFNLTSGSCLRWLRDSITIEETKRALELGIDPYDWIIEEAAGEPTDMIFMPHFGPTGTPHFAANGTGVLFGMMMPTTRGQIIRAFLEGITYAMKWNLKILDDTGIRLSEIRAIGGGAKNARWMQIKADVLGVPITTMEVSEATCMGAALIAAGGAGLVDTASAINDWAKPIRTFEPNRSLRAAYDDRMAVYQELWQALGTARERLAVVRTGAPSNQLDN